MKPTEMHGDGQEDGKPEKQIGDSEGALHGSLTERETSTRDVRCPTADILAELAALANRSVNARARLREFLDTKPVIAALKVDCAATVRAGHTVYADEPSQALMDALEAVRVAANDTEGDGGSGSHCDSLLAWLGRLLG